MLEICFRSLSLPIFFAIYFSNLSRELILGQSVLKLQMDKFRHLIEELWPCMLKIAFAQYLLKKIFEFDKILCYNTCVPAPKCDRRPHFGAVGIAGLYIGRLRNCLPFLTSFTQCRMANLHIKCFDINAHPRLECYRALK